MNKFPRKQRLDLNTKAEIMIFDAIQEVEKLGADPLLTEVVVILLKAKDALAEHIDKQLSEL